MRRNEQHMSEADREGIFSLSLWERVGVRA
jgi:hypothetical protein